MRIFSVIFTVLLLNIYMADLVFSDVLDVLKDKVICIDPGHQRFANKEQEPISPNSQNTKPKVAAGAEGVKSGTPEYIITLKIAKKLKKLLKNKGVVVVMTRERDDVNISNVERALLGNKVNAEIMIRIHADSSMNSSKRGISMLIPSKNGINNLILWAKSRKAGEIILKKTVETTKSSDLGIFERDDLSGFNWSEIPVILIETGFLSNIEDDKLLNSKSYQHKLAEGICDGLIEYLVESNKESYNS